MGFHERKSRERCLAHLQAEVLTSCLSGSQRDNRLCMHGRWLIDLLFPKLTLSTLNEALQAGISLPLRDNQTLRH